MHIPQQLHHAQIALQTLKWFWESAEEQVPALIDATAQRIVDDEWPFWEGIEEEALDRPRVSHHMQQIVRTNTLLQAWIIFEDTVNWLGNYYRTQSLPIDAKQPNQSFDSWAVQAFEIGLYHPWGQELHTGLEQLRQLRNMFVHTNGRVSAFTKPQQELVETWMRDSKDITINEEKLEVSTVFVQRMLRIVELAISDLTRPFWKAKD